MRQVTIDQLDDWLPKTDPVLSSLDGVVLTRKDLTRLASSAASATTKGKTVNNDRVKIAYNCLLYLEGTKQTKATLKRVMGWLLGNWNFVMAGMLIPEWNGEPEQCDLVVLGVAARAVTKTGPRYLLRVKLKTGLPAGIIQCTDVPAFLIRQFLDHKSGTAAYNCADEEIAGMRIRAVVSLASRDIVKIENLMCTESMKKYNRRLAAARSDPARCTHGEPCNVCKKLITECPLAVWAKEQR